MQILESSILGLRAVRMTFRRKSGDVSVTLFPMVHLGDAEFYRTIYADAATHDVVLTEGIRSPVTVRLTRSYRWAVGSKRLGLTMQPPFALPEGSAARIVHADLSATEFEAAWHKVPLGLRCLIYLVAPLIGLSLRWRGSRGALSKRLRMDVEPTIKEALINPETAILAEVILKQRDDRLLEILGRELDQFQGPGQIAVIYGAAHMRAVIRELTDVRDFKPGDFSWVTIFSL